MPAGSSRRDGHGFGQVSETERDGDLVAAYNRLLNGHPDPAVRATAAQNWCELGGRRRFARGEVDPQPPLSDRRLSHDLHFRLWTHYFSHAAWLDSDQLLRNADRLAGIPGVLVHGRFDLGGPPHVPWLLARAWPAAELHLVRTGQVGGVEMMEELLRATDRFAVQR